MAKNRQDKIQQRAPIASSKSDWHAHIRALGLSSVEEYQKWCRKHGFKFNRKKTWRQQRQEYQLAELERTNATALQHIQTLKLKTVEEYQEWCRQHGFRDALTKKGSQRRKELELAEQLQQKNLDSPLEKKPELSHRERQLADLAAAKRQRSQTPDLLKQIHASSLGADELKSATLRKVHAAFANLEEDGRDALLQLLLHVEHNADLLNTASASERQGRQPGNTFVEAVLALGRHYRDWLRPIDTWQHTSRNQRTQFNSLARHLLAQYDVPFFMDAVWFRADAEGQRQQEWFKHIGRGGNIRSADIPIQASKKMAHHFLQAPDHYTVEEALRWGQIRGQDGIPFLAEAINATRLGRSFENEKFWSAAIHFFARQPNLELDWIGPIVEYMHHQKFTTEEFIHPDGRRQVVPPPQPNLSMKSRSLPKLLRQVGKWKERWNWEARQQEDKETASGKPKFSHFYYEEIDEKESRTLDWSIQELTTARALATEGEAMRHCVASYSKRLNKTSIWSLQVREGNRTHRIMTISINNEDGIVTEAKGRFNADPAIEVDAQAMAGEPRARGRLNRTDRDYLGRSHKILHLWLERESITYFPRR